MSCSGRLAIKCRYADSNERALLRYRHLLDCRVLWIKPCQLASANLLANHCSTPPPRSFSRHPLWFSDCITSSCLVSVTVFGMLCNYTTVCATDHRTSATHRDQATKFQQLCEGVAEGMYVYLSAVAIPVTAIQAQNHIFAKRNQPESNSNTFSLINMHF